MLAYFYCAAYTRMTMYESSSPCGQRRIIALHLTMMNRECSWLNLSYQRHITFACTGCYQLHPHHRLGIITPTYCRYQFTDPERMDSLVS